MKYLSILVVFTVNLSFSQPQGRIDDIIDDITYQWDTEASSLKTYVGLLKICHDQDYKNKIISLLNDIHHYDTILYGVLVKIKKDREIRQTLKEIKTFEEEYNTDNFIHFMHAECQASDILEKEFEELKNGVANNSYSGQVYILETELFKYVKNITGRVDQIRNHVHHIRAHFYD